MVLAKAREQRPQSRHLFEPLAHQGLLAPVLLALLK